MRHATPLLRRSAAAHRVFGRVTLQVSVRAGPAGSLLRRRPASTTSAALDGIAGPPPLRCGRAGIKSRSLAPDDPFGERGAWEDPSDGVFAAWNGVDQEGFVHAAESQEVRQAHFGPEWARFTTVGRMSVKKMREEQQHENTSAAATDASASASTSATAATPARRYPTAEELHEADLLRRRQLMQRNYTSYEAFVEHELGGGGGDGESVVDVQDDASLGAAGALARTGLYSAASMESAFSEVDGVHGRDRMAQRNLERAALDTVEAAEVVEEMSLPPFMRESAARDDATAAMTAASTAAPPPPPPSPPHAATAATEITRRPRPSVPDASAVANEAATAIPAAFARQVLDALGAPHGDARLPLTDPMHWATEDVICFLTLMEQPSSGAEAPATMDETMCDTFRMARVTGDTLLNVVVPPRLFRLMRRWHVRRHDAVSKAWRRHQSRAEHARGESDSSSSTTASEAALSQSRERLAEAVQQLDSTLIQETILLCFPYGH